jgi:hypothetical protein
MPRPTATMVKAFALNLRAAAWLLAVQAIQLSHGFPTLSTYGRASSRAKLIINAVILTHASPQWMNNNGWKMIGTQCCGPAGSVVIYDETSAGNDHAAFSVGGGLICQHNPGRCRCRMRALTCCCLPRLHLQNLTQMSHFSAPQATGASIACIAKVAELALSTLPICKFCFQMLSSKKKSLVRALQH